MVSTYNKFEKEQLEMLLWVYGNLDMVLDEGMTMGEEIKSTLNRALFWVLKALRDYEKKIGQGYQSERIFIAYIDQFSKLVVLTSGGQIQVNPEDDLRRILKSEGIIKQDISELEEVGDRKTPDMVIASLEVFNEFLGSVVLCGKNLTSFHKRFISLVAEKIDTDIFQYNRLTLERLKNQGIEKINSILDSNIPLNKKYQKVMRLLVESVEAYSGYLVIPREGKLSLSNQYIDTCETTPLAEEDVIALARKTVERNQVNTFIPIKEVPVSNGEILSILLRPVEDQVEGIIVLHHPDFKRGHAEVANAYSNLIDSTLHVNQLYAGIFENFLTAFGVIIDTFDSYPSGRSHRRTHYAMALGKAMGLSKLEMSRLRIASMMYDLDKVGVDPRTIKKRAKIASRCLRDLGGHNNVSDKILDSLFPFDLKSFSNKLDLPEDTDEINVHEPGVETSKMSILSKIIRIADTFDTITSDRPYKRGMDREGACKQLEQSVNNYNVTREMVELFTSQNTWRDIRRVFQNFKIEQSIKWFTNNMLPDIAPIEKELESAKESIGELRNVRSHFERGDVVNLNLLENSLLSPSDKDILIQREAQKNPSTYNQLLNDMKSKYNDKVMKLEARRKMENRFREKFWDPSLIGEISHNLAELNEKGADFYDRRDNLKEITGNDPCGRDTGNLMSLIDCLLNRSIQQKGLNRSYINPLKKLEKIIDRLIEDYQD